jgi:hypothetical protein
VWEQLNIARHMDTTQIWVLNVGDLKFLETPTEWFLSLAYDFDRFDEKGLVAWFEDVARRDFGVAGSAAGEVGDIMGTYSVSPAEPRALCGREPSDAGRCTQRDAKRSLWIQTRTASSTSRSEYDSVWRGVLADKEGSTHLG